MKILQEFKTFAMKGNVVDMAVGVIIGGAFGKIVSSLVNDVLMPPIGKVLGGVDFKHLYWNLSGGTFENLEAAKAAKAITVNYGMFINNIIDFVIVAFVIFMMIKGMNALQRREEVKPTVAPPPPSREVVLLEEIRDLLKKK